MKIEKISKCHAIILEEDELISVSTKKSYYFMTNRKGKLIIEKNKVD